jgi:uncharacterized protein YndB with AHSA1/START domain
LLPGADCDYFRAMVELEIHQHFSAPPAKVFAAVTDHKRIEGWQKGTRVTIEKPGVPPPNGLGAVRRISGGPLSVWEEVVRWEEPNAMDYRLVRGFPLHDHLGEIRCKPTPEGGTLLEYRIRYRVPWYAGGSVVARLFGRQLERVIGAAMQKLAKEVK